MHREVTSAFVLSMILALGACAAPPDSENAKTDPEPDAVETKPVKNPFGLVDIEEDFFGEELQQWASRVELAGNDDDPNAEPWAAPSTERGFDSIDGEWSSRWSEPEAQDKGWTNGTATIKTVGDRVFFLFRDDEQEYLCEALREDDRLVGTYVNVDPLERADNGPWVGIIVDTNRIDGTWLDGRWDFRRVTADAG